MIQRRTGELRLVRQFAWLPLRIGRTFVWLGFYYEEQSLQYAYDTTCGWNGYIWRMVDRYPETKRQGCFDWTT